MGGAKRSGHVARRTLAIGLCLLLTTLVVPLIGTTPAALANGSAALANGSQPLPWYGSITITQTHTLDQYGRNPAGEVDWVEHEEDSTSATYVIGQGNVPTDETYSYPAGGSYSYTKSNYFIANDCRSDYAESANGSAAVSVGLEHKYYSEPDRLELEIVPGQIETEGNYTRTSTCSDPTSGTTPVYVQPSPTFPAPIPQWAAERDPETGDLVVRGSTTVHSDTADDDVPWHTSVEDTTYTVDLRCDDPCAVVPHPPDDLTLSWQAEERAPDRNNDGRLDDDYIEGKWTTKLGSGGLVKIWLDVCSTSGSATNFVFMVDGTPFEKTSCRSAVRVSEGEHSIEVSASGPDGEAFGEPETIDVVHHLVVGLGDSYGSGETGAPKSTFDDPNCRRASWSAQTKGAVQLENSDPHSTVTFLHLACSGAKVDMGLVTGYPNPPGGTPIGKSQVRQALDLTHGYSIDAVLLSIGGNDIGFSSVIETCAIHGDCPLKKSDGITLHDRTQNKLSSLPNRLERLATCISGGPRRCSAEDWPAGVDSLGVARANVVHSEYPDVATRSLEGSKGLVSPDGYRYCKNALYQLDPFRGKGITQKEFRWAREVVQRGAAGTEFPFAGAKLQVEEPGLNNVIAAAPTGWSPAIGAFEVFRGHGYCAPDGERWIVNYADAAPNPKPDAFHPNKIGYAAWGPIMANVLIDRVQ